MRLLLYRTTYPGQWMLPPPLYRTNQYETIIHKGYIVLLPIVLFSA